VGKLVTSALRWDAQLLQDALRESVRTSPDSFLMTVEDIDAKPLGYWMDEIVSSTWVVAQRRGDVVGTAVARWPDDEMDTDIDPDTARFIESVWIAPDLRGHRISERLLRFLFEQECEKNPEIRQFLLWVFDDNHHAIRLYERMGFEYTTVQQRHAPAGMTELMYRLSFGSAEMKAAETAVNEAARRHDRRQYGVTYRVLGEQHAP